MMKKNHPYHLVQMSPWPFLASLAAMCMTLGLSKWFDTSSMNLMTTGFMIMIMASYQWWRDMSREASLTGDHTKTVKKGLRLGMILFIISEVMFFFSFFWAFFHSTLTTTMELGAQWPPSHIKPFDPTKVPLLNTTILLASGVTVTWAHHSAIASKQTNTNQALMLTVTLGVYFSALQALEYFDAPFSMADSVYGSTFFLATGFHGLHVIIGSIFLACSLFRLNLGQISPKNHLGLEAAIWYWHFVDVVWLFLYASIYWWGS